MPTPAWNGTFRPAQSMNVAGDMSQPLDTEIPVIPAYGPLMTVMLCRISIARAFGPGNVPAGRPPGQCQTGQAGSVWPTS